MKIEITLTDAEAMQLVNEGYVEVSRGGAAPIVVIKKDL